MNQLRPAVSVYRYTSAKFDIAEHLKDGSKSVEELAEATSTNSDARSPQRGHSSRSDELDVEL